MRSRRTSAGAENAPDRATQQFMEKIQEDQREERNETGLSMKHNAAKEPQPEKSNDDSELIKLVEG